MVLISASMIAYYIYKLGTGKIIQQGIRFSLTCILAFFLIQGSSKARWITISLLGIAIVFSAIGAISLFQKGMNGMLMVFLAIVYSGCILGLLSPRAGLHFGPWSCERCGEVNPPTENTCRDCELKRHSKVEPGVVGNG